MKRGGKLPLEKAQKGVCAGRCLQNGLESHTAMWGTLRGMERKACFSSCYAPTFGSRASFLKASSADCRSDDGGPHVSPSSSLKKRGLANSCPDSHKTENSSMDGCINRGLGRGDCWHEARLSIANLSVYLSPYLIYVTFYLYK